MLWLMLDTLKMVDEVLDSVIQPSPSFLHSGIIWHEEKPLIRVFTKSCEKKKKYSDIIKALNQNATSYNWL